MDAVPRTGSRVSDATVDLDCAYVANVYRRQPLELVSGRGSYVTAKDGREYLDFVTGLSVNNFGHCHPQVVAAIREQAGRLIQCSNLFLTEPQARLAARLSKLAGGGEVFFCNSGAEANEAALKVARKRVREKGGGVVLSLERSFHGRTLGTLFATGQPDKQEPFGPPLPGYRQVPAGDARVLEEAFRAERVAAFIAEPVMGESGVLPVPSGYLHLAQSLCREHDALFVVDEVQTGLGRCGSYFAYQRYGLDPDVITLAKSLAGGLPMGATIFRGKARGVLCAGEHGTTFGGSPLVASAALAVLDLLEQPGLTLRIETQGRRLEEWLCRLETAGAAVDVRRLGLMAAVDLASPCAPQTVEAALDEGILLNATSDRTLRFLPSLLVEDEEIDRVGSFLLTHLTGGE